MLTVNELTNWNIKASIEAKYRSLKCHIETVQADTYEYKTIDDMISSTTNTFVPFSSILYQQNSRSTNL